MSGPETVVALLVMAIIGSVVIPIARALARRIAGGGPDSRTLREVQGLRGEVDQLRGELDAVHDRLAGVDELHNRVDFAERLLAQARERGALGSAREAS